MGAANAIARDVLRAAKDHASADEVRDDLAARIRAAGISSAVVRVVRPGLEPIEWSFARADGETVFRLFSGTKLFTAAAIMRLVAQGSMGLEDDVGTLVGAADRPGWDGLVGVSVRQLLSHTSGLVDSSVAAFMSTHPPAIQPGPPIEELLSRFDLRASSRRTDGVARYANVNYLLLGLLLERVTRQPYSAALGALVLAPLGSRACFSYADAAALGDSPRAIGTAGVGTLLALSAVLGRAAAGALVDRRAAPSPPLPWGTRALRQFDLDGLSFGGLLGRARDFSPLLEAALCTADPSAASAVPAALAAELAPPVVFAEHGAQPVGIEAKAGAGLGWKLGVCADGTHFCTHEGGGGGFATEMRVYPSLGVGVVVLLNCWSLDMREARLSHAICEAVRSAHARGTLGAA